MVEVLAEDVSTGVSRTIKLLMSGDEPSPLARKAGRETGSRRRRSRRSGRDSDSPGRRQEGRRPGDGSSAIQPVFTPTGGADQKLEAHQIPSDASAAVILPPQTATELAGVVLPLQPHPAVVSASAEIREVSQKDLEKNQIEQSPAHPMDSRGPGPVSLSSLVIPPPPPASADASSTDGRGTRAQASPDPPTSVPYGTEYRNYMGETALPMPVSSGSANPSAAGASGTGSRARQSGMPDVVRKALNYMDAGDRGPIARAHYLEATEPLQVYILQNLHLFQEASKAVSILIEIEEKAGARRILQALGNQPDTDPSAVAGLYEQFLQKFPQDNEATNGLAKSLSMAGREDEAIVRLESITNKDDSSAIQVETLIQLYRNRLSTVPDDHAVQFKLIKLLIRTGKIDEAVNLLQRLVTVESYKVRALKILGLCFWQKGLHYLAWQKLQQLPLNDEIRDILYRLSQDMEDTDQILNAKVVLQHLVQDNPNYRDASERLKKVEQLIRMEAGKPEANLTPSIFLTMKDSRFVILEEINRGSMGIVYRAKDKVLDEIIALKILNDYMTADQNAVERFKREARAAKRLAHPNIVRIHDMFEYGDKKILSMEHIEGRDLKKVLIEKKTLGTQEIVKIGKAVADALGYAHGLSVVHRDIKPANIMITSDDRVKVTDFGIAKLLAGNDTTRSGSQIIGTPLYMSPEQIRGLAVDARTDIYSLGATLYEAACGRPPFMEGNIEYHHLHTPPPALPDSVDPKLASIIMKCLEKDPENRWEDTQVLVKALSEVEAQ
jgi:tRNA A-37 threonylcarbamoyl transferase component Bud32